LIKKTLGWQFVLHVLQVRKYNISNYNFIHGFCIEKFLSFQFEEIQKQLKKKEQAVETMSEKIKSVSV
jgi:hypothetical protein